MLFADTGPRLSATMQQYRSLFIRKAIPLSKDVYSLGYNIKFYHVCFLFGFISLTALIKQWFHFNRLYRSPVAWNNWRFEFLQPEEGLNYQISNHSQSPVLKSSGEDSVFWILTGQESLQVLKVRRGFLCPLYLTSELLFTLFSL